MLVKHFHRLSLHGRNVSAPISVDDIVNNKFSNAGSPSIAICDIPRFGVNPEIERKPSRFGIDTVFPFRYSRGDIEKEGCGAALLHLAARGFDKYQRAEGAQQTGALFTARDIRQLINTIYFNIRQEIPDKSFSNLTKIVRESAGIDLPKGGLGVTAPFPVWHRSGAFKDVFRLECLVFSTEKIDAFRQIDLAVKISRKPGGISEAEIEYHKIMNGGDPWVRPTTRLLSVLPLSMFPEVPGAFRGLTMTIEKFEPGKQFLELINSESHLAAAVAASKTFLRMIDRAIDSGHGISREGVIPPGTWNQGYCSHELTAVKFPTDINPANMIIRADGTALMCDVGEHHPYQRPSEIFLRIIRNYFTGDIQHRFRVLPLDNLFELIYTSGGMRGESLLRELALSVGRAAGIQDERLKKLDRCNLLRCVDLALAESFGYSETPARISKLIRSQASALRYRHASRDADDTEPFDSEFHIRSARAAYLLLTPGQMRGIFQQLESYLQDKPRQGRASILFCNNEEIDSQLALERGRIAKPKAMDVLDPRPSVLTRSFAGEQVEAEDLIRRALIVAPLPNVELIKLAALTVNIFPRNIGPADDESSYLYNHRVGIVAVMYNKLFKEAGMSTLPDIIKVLAGPKGKEFEQLSRYMEASWEKDKSMPRSTIASYEYFQCLQQLMLQFIQTIYLSFCRSSAGDQKALDLLCAPSDTLSSNNDHEFLPPRLPTIWESPGLQGQFLEGARLEASTDRNDDKPGGTDVTSNEAANAAALNLFANNLTLIATTERSWTYEVDSLVSPDL